MSRPDAMLIVDAAGIVRYANCRATSLFGYYHDEVVGKPVDRLLPDRSCTALGKTARTPACGRRLRLEVWN